MGEAGKGVAGRALALLARLPQKNIYAGGNLFQRVRRVYRGAKHGILAAVIAGAAIPLQCAAESVAAPQREKLQEERLVNRVENAALQQAGVNLLRESVAFLPTIAPDSKAMTEQPTRKHADERPRGDRPSWVLPGKEFEEIDLRILYWIAVSYIPLLIGVYICSR